MKNGNISFLRWQADKNLAREQQATQALLKIGLKLVEKGVPGVAPGVIHKWFMDDEAQFPQSKV